MAEVYQRATFNILVEAAGNCQEGLFVQQDPRQLGAFNLDQQQTPNLSYGLYACYTTDYMRERRARHASRPLIHPTWVYQESLLALRKINFFKGQVFWKCNETVACEMFPDGEPEEAYDVTRLVAERMELNLDGSPSRILAGQEMSDQELSEGWLGLSAVYMGKDLTKEKTSWSPYRVSQNCTSGPNKVIIWLVSGEDL